MKKNIIFISSIALLLYFALLIKISICQIHLNTFIEAVFELITIPSIILLVALLFVNLKGWHYEKWKIASKTFFSFFLNILSIALLVIATIYDK